MLVFFRLVKGFVLFIFSLIAISCYRELQFEEPKLGQELMVSVLADIHLAEGQITQYAAMPPGARDSLASQHYITIFKLHSISANDFEQSMEAYIQNPEALSKLYEKVLEKLEKDEVLYGK